MSGVLPPVNVDVPYASQNGNVLNCTMGNWQNEPTAYSYQWNDGTADVGTDTADFPIYPAYVGRTFTCVVTATNAGGSTVAPPSNGVEVVGSEPPTQEDIDRVFRAVRAQSTFLETRENWIEQCEHYSVSLNEALIFCTGPEPETHLAEIGERLDWAIDHVGELRAEVAAVEPPAPAEPSGTPPASLTQQEVDAAERIANALRMLAELQGNVLRQCDQITVTLQVAKQWSIEEDAAEHVPAITNGVHGSIEQTARLRSMLGSTQT